MSALAEIDDTRPRINIRSDLRWKEVVKAIPGANWDRADGVWHIPLSWVSCLALRSTFHTDLEIGPKLASWAWVAKDRAETLIEQRDLIEADGNGDLYPFQRAGVKFLAHARRALLADDPGCLTGDVEIIVNRAGAGRRMTLAELHKKFNGGVSRNGHSRWRTDVPTRVKSLMPDDVLRLNTVVAVIDKGVRPVIKITLDSGKTITCTYDHEISRGPFTEWTRTDQLSVGDQVATNGVPICIRCGSDDQVIVSASAKWRGYCRACMYRYKRRDKHNPVIKDEYRNLDGDYWMIGKQWDHPNASKRGWIPEHVLVASTAVGRAIESGEHVHHINGVKTDNRPTNLKVLTASEHTRYHGILEAYKHFNGTSGKRGENWFMVKLDTITSIEPAGEQRVYDLVMEDPGRNFVANGVVVHNSGKTVQAIRTLADMYGEQEEVFPTLVVCPSSMKKTWMREFARWWPGVEVSIIKGTAGQRRKALEKPAHVYVMNWESLRGHSRLAAFGSIALTRCPECGGEDEKITETRCQVHERELNKMKFKSVIADECHRAASPQAQQTRALWAATGDAEIRIALTGTPIANNVTDLWSILHWLDAAAFPGKSKWMDRFINTMMNTWGATIVMGVKPEMYDEFYAGVNPYFRRMPKSLVLPFLPPIIYDRRDVEMSAKQAKAYKQMAEELVMELDGGLVTAGSPLVKVGRLAQLASSFGEVSRTEDVDTVTGELTTHVKVMLTEPSSKLDAFMDDLEDFGDESVAVMAVSKQLINLLAARLDKKRIPYGIVTGDVDEDDRTRHIDDFQAGKTKLFLFTAAAGGVGITLTAARRLARLQRPWSRVLDEQSLNRVHRIGSEKHEKIIVTDYIVADTVEEAIIERLLEKGENAEEVVRDKDLLRKLLGGDAL